MASSAHPNYFCHDTRTFAACNFLPTIKEQVIQSIFRHNMNPDKRRLWSNRKTTMISLNSSLQRKCGLLSTGASSPLSCRRGKGIFLCAYDAGICDSEEVDNLSFSEKVLVNALKHWKQVKIIALSGLLTCAIWAVPPADAIDALKTCTCLLKECRVELAKCIANPSCAANVACLQTCNNRSDETECQIKCGDLFENSVVDEFNECAVSSKKCVPQKSDVGEFPIPDASALVKSFNMADFNGKWYILSSKIENKSDDYIFVYYRGRNDAWDGYGGAVVYTRSAVLPESIVPELEQATKSIGRDFNKFIKTDNTCGPEPPLVERLEKTVEEGERTIVREVEEIEAEVEKVGKTEVTLFQRLSEGFKELMTDEQNFVRDLSKEEMEVLEGLKMEAAEVEKLFGRTLPLRKLR